MKNITLSVDEDVLAAVRKYAASLDTTVNALVREHLAQLAARETRVREARKELLQLFEESPLDLGAEVGWSREATHDRDGLRRRERPPLRGVSESD